jgi:AraC-like DNA-binding protein
MSAVFRPHWIRAGFHAELDAGGSGLRHAGEQWAPARFLIGPHTHPVWEYYLQLHGESNWLADGRLFALQPGHLLAIPPGTRHQMQRESSRNNHFCFAAIDLAPALGRYPELAADWSGPPATIHRAEADGVTDPFRQVTLELTADRRHATTGLLLAVDRLVLEVTRQLRDRRPPTVMATHPAVAVVKKLLDHRSARRWTLDALSREVGLAPGYLAALFTREIGMSPHRYLNESRARQAQHLLATGDVSITAIGLEVGFGSGQHFARVFRQVSGESPGQYRHRKQHAIGRDARSSGPAVEFRLDDRPGGRLLAERDSEAGS